MKKHQKKKKKKPTTWHQKKAFLKIRQNTHSWSYARRNNESPSPNQSRKRVSLRAEPVSACCYLCRASAQVDEGCDEPESWEPFIPVADA